MTVLFRALLAIPHLLVIEVLTIAADAVAFLGWWGALFMGRLPNWAASFLSGYMQWVTRFQAYALLLTDAYPPFMFDDAPGYPVRVAMKRERLNRAAVLFRCVLYLPAGMLYMLLVYGADTIMLLVTWIIALVAGRLPTPLHLAYAAVLRFQTRLFCYMLLLTPAYPGGLYGDRNQGPDWQIPSIPGAPYPTPSYPAVGCPPAVGYPAPGYPSAPGSAVPPAYGTPPAAYATPPAAYATPPAAYATPPPPYGTGGEQAEGAPDFGKPTTYGYAPQPAPGYGAGETGIPQPADALAPAATSSPVGMPPATDWRIVLTPGAKRLVTAFIAIGSACIVALVTLMGIAVGSGVVSAASKEVTAVNAFNTVTKANLKLHGQFIQYQNELKTCGGLSCLDAQAATMAADFTAYARLLSKTPVPTSVSGATAQTAADARLVALNLTEVSQSGSMRRYQTTLSDAALSQAVSQFSAENNDLINALNSATTRN